MLTYNLKECDGPLYIALYNAIRGDIISGILPPGGKLPSKRNLAVNNGISVITVENAYALLLDEGYISSKPRSGFYICDLSSLPERKNRERKEILQDVVAEERNLYSLADFRDSRTPCDLFPFESWVKATRKVFAEKKEKLLDNPPSEGAIELRRSIQKYLEEYRGLSVSPERIVIGAGSEYLYSLLISLIGRDKVYGIEDPGYRKEEKIYLKEGAEVVHLPLDECGIIPGANSPCVLHITPSHQYPTGIVMPVSRRYELLAWAAEESGRWIIEDDYDSELRLDGKPIPSLSSIDTIGCVIYLNTFSKTLSSSVRISYMVLPDRLMDKYRRELSFYSSSVSTFEQYTLNEFMESGKMGGYINRMRTYYRRKRDTFLSALKKKLGERIEITGEKAGLYFLLHVHTSRSEDEIIRDAKEEGIGLVALSGFYHNAETCPGEKRNTYIMNYASLDASKTEIIVEVLSHIF